MAQNLPGPEKLLGEMLRFKPYTRAGQWQAARRIEELVRDCALGTIDVIPFTLRKNSPEGAPDYPFIRIRSSFGGLNAQRSKILMTWLGHIDTVEPLPDELDKDPFVIETAAGDDKDEAIRFHVGKKIGKRRGTDDMWAGNLAKLFALQELRDSGTASVEVQTIFSSREEAGSEVLHRAIDEGEVDRAPVGATTEILVGDDGKTSPIYHARTGRIGIEVEFYGEAPHSGEVNRRPDVINHIAHRFFARGLDELLDEERGFSIQNRYPNDNTGVLPTIAKAIPGKLRGEPKGLSVPGTIRQHFDIFHSDPNLDAAQVVDQMNEYFTGVFASLIEKTDFIPFSVREENREGVPFTDPYLTPADHVLMDAARASAKHTDSSPPVETSASGVAEDGMLFHRLGTKMVGRGPIGRGAHDREWVLIDSIPMLAQWLKGLAQFDGSYDE